jgi:hypothetical protein
MRVWGQLGNGTSLLLAVFCGVICLASQSVTFTTQAATKAAIRDGLVLGIAGVALAARVWAKASRRLRLWAGVAIVLCGLVLAGAVRFWVSIAFS